MAKNESVPKVSRIRVKFPDQATTGGAILPGTRGSPPTCLRPLQIGFREQPSLLSSG
jgi:hypothetical protein